MLELVKRPIPHLVHGTGSGKTTIRLALCDISTSGRQTYPDKFNRRAHLINMKASVKRGISLFLTQYPIPTFDSSQSVKDKPQADHEGSDSELWVFATQVDGQLAEGEEYSTNYRMDLEVGSDAAGKHAMRRGGVAVSRSMMLQTWHLCKAQMRLQVMCTSGMQVSIVQIYLSNYSIYFQHLSKLTQLLFARGTLMMIVAWVTNHLHHWVHTEVLTGISANEYVNNKLTSHIGVSSVLGPAHGFQMPPPPPLACNLDTSRDKQIAVEGMQIKG